MSNHELLSNSAKCLIRIKARNILIHNFGWDQTLEYAAEVPPLAEHPVNKAAAE